MSLSFDFIHEKHPITSDRKEHADINPNEQSTVTKTLVNGEVQRTLYSLFLFKLFKCVAIR